MWGQRSGIQFGAAEPSLKAVSVPPGVYRVMLGTPGSDAGRLPSRALAVTSCPHAAASGRRVSRAALRGGGAGPGRLAPGLADLAALGASGAGSCFGGSGEGTSL